MTLVEKNFDDRLIQLANTDGNRERIRNIDKCFGNDDQPLCKEGRVLVGEGLLVKMCRKEPKKRYFFLFTDILVYGTCVLDKRKYIHKHIISLRNTQIKSIPDSTDSKLRNGWLILNPKKSFSVYATTLKEKHEWMTHIQNCINKLNGGPSTSGSKNVAPAWIPDKEAEKCMTPNCTSKFNVLNRRHHCRHCGFVVCGDCSQRRFLLEYQSDEPVRVCDMCFNKLSSSNNNNRDYSSDDDDHSLSSEPKFYD